MSGPSTSPPIQVELDSFRLDDRSGIGVRVRFEDGAAWDVEWPLHPADAREVFDVFGDHPSRTIARFAQPGLRTTEVIPAEDGDAE